MDYEKKYKEALGWMQSLYNGLHGKTKEEAEKYFPELKESEDEKIRKALVRFHKSTIDVDGIKGEDILSWLEKQGEQKPIMNVPTREVILAIWDLGNEWKELTSGDISTEYGTQLDYIQKHWHESEYYLREKQGEHDETSIAIKNPEAYRIGFADGEAHAKEEKNVWSDEDEENLQHCCGAIGAADYYTYDDKQEMEEWLKSLKERLS